MKNKYIFNTSELLYVLKKIKTIIPPRASLPILYDYLFYFDHTNSSCIIKTTNLNTTAQACIYYDIMQNETKENIAFGINAKILYETLKENKDEGVISLTYDTNTSKCILETQTGTYNIKTSDSKEFPLNKNHITDFSNEDEQFIFNTIDFFNAINVAQNFCSEDELKPAMQGIFLDTNVLVATNAHVLSKNIITNNNKNTIQETINTDALVLLKSIISNVNDEFYIINKENLIILKYKEFIIFTKKNELKFPDYKSVLPNLDKYNSFLLTHSELTHAVKRVGLYIERKNGSNLIEIKATNEKFILTSDENMCGHSAEEYVPCITDYKDNMNIGFDCNQLLKVLNNINTQNIFVYFSEHSKAAIFKSETSEDFILLMPLLLRSNF